MYSAYLLGQSNKQTANFFIVRIQREWSSRGQKGLERPERKRRTTSRKFRKKVKAENFSSRSSRHHTLTTRSGTTRLKRCGFCCVTTKMLCFLSFVKLVCTGFEFWERDSFNLVNLKLTFQGFIRGSVHKYVCPDYNHRK